MLEGGGGGCVFYIYFVSLREGQVARNDLPGVVFDMVVFRQLQLDPVEKNLKVVGRWQSCMHNGVEYINSFQRPGAEKHKEISD
jgi:hypothetical protein